MRGGTNFLDSFNNKNSEAWQTPVREEGISMKNNARAHIPIDDRYQRYALNKDHDYLGSSASRM